MNHRPMSSSHANASANAQPRLACRVARAWSAWRETDAATAAPAPGAAARHVAGCADCARHFAALVALEKGLRAEARVLAAQEPALPLGMEDRIWAAVRPVLREQRVNPLRRWLPTALGAAAAIALTTAVWTHVDSNEVTPIASAAATEFGAEDLQQLAASIETLSQKVLAAPAVVQVAAQQPGSLDSELRALRSDATGALRFLERSFLPSTMRLTSNGESAELSG